MSSIIIFFIFIPLLAFILLAINLIFAPHNPYQEKSSPFESGFSSFLGQNRTQFDISFFIFALLFLLFDLEVLLIYPYIVSAYNNGVYGLIVMLVFFIVLTLGFAFELGKKALSIDSRQTSNVGDKETSVISKINYFNKKNFNNVSYINNSIRYMSSMKNNNSNNKNNNQNKRTFFPSLNLVKLGLIKVYKTPTLPSHIISLNNNIFMRIFGVIGGMCLLLTLSKKIFDFNEYIIYIVIVINLLFLIYQFILLLYTIINIYRILKSDELDIRNSPINKYVTILTKGLLCIKGVCERGILTGIVLGTGIVFDWALESANKEKVFLKLATKQYILYSKLSSTKKIAYKGSHYNLVFTKYLKSNIISANIRVSNSLQQRYYSTGTNDKVTNTEEIFKSIKSEFLLQDKTNYISNTDFKQWFVGLVDGEGNFDINRPVLGKYKFAFRVRIKLHIDDLPLLNYIKIRLNCGYMEINKTNASLVFSKHDWLKNIIFPIFDEFPLNSCKYLNFVDLKKAFYLYINSPEYGNSKIKKSEVVGNEILLLKANMNFKRTNFKMPLNHSINITPYWLLGFIEGEGCFCSSKLRAAFSINLTLADKPLLLKIQEFLNQLDPINNLFFDKELQKPRGILISKAGVNDYLKLRSKTHRPLTCLSISQTDFFYKFFIPFLDKLVFLSKKKKDYLDWRLVVFIIYWNMNETELGKSLIYDISKGMNNNRLSTNKGGLKYLEPKLHEKINKIPSTVYIDNHGLRREVNTNKLLNQKYLVIAVPLELVRDNNCIKCFGKKYTLVLFVEKIFNLKILPSNFLLFYSIMSCQRFFNISNTKIQSLFDKNGVVKYDSICYCLFRFNTNIS